MAKPFLIEVRGERAVVLGNQAPKTAPRPTKRPVVIETTGEAVS